MQVQKLQIVRWSETTPPQESELRRRLQEQGLSPYTWSNAPGDRYAVHSHNYNKVLYCIQGSIRFVLPDYPEGIENIDLKAGDYMCLPGGVRHSALVGSQGVRCIEAARY